MTDSNLEAAWKIRLESEIKNLAGHLDNFRKHNVELASENSALKAEVKQVESVCAQVGHQLTLEREISAMLREALEEIAKPIPESIHTSKVEVKQTAAAQRALAREKEMRK